MYRVEQYIPHSIANDLLEALQKADDAWYVDREKHFNNLTMEGKTSKYDCILEDSMPERVKKLIDYIKPWDTDEVIINRYQKGMSIGRHHDGCISPFVSVLTLQSHHDVVRVYPEDGLTHPVPDKAGQMYTISSSTEHEVLPVESERFSIVMLRGMMQNDY